MNTIGRTGTATVRSALENLAPDSGVNDHFRRGIVVGLVSGLIAEGMTCQAAFRFIKDNWSDHLRVAGVPEVWHDECVPAARRVAYSKQRQESIDKVFRAGEILVQRTRNSIWRGATPSPSDDVVTVELVLTVGGTARLVWNPQFVTEHSAEQIADAVLAKLDLMATLVNALEGGPCGR